MTRWKGFPVVIFGCFARPEPRSYLEVYREKFGARPAIDPIEIKAVQFIIETVRSNPNEVTLLAVGPCTNIAHAVRIAPEIVPLIKRVVYMGGAFEVPGNTTPAVEFNWWFDPEAAKICVRTPFADQLVVGLDVCEKYRFGVDIYQRIMAVESPVTALFAAQFAERFDRDPENERLVWDTIAAAVVIDPSLITREKRLWIDVDTGYGLDYGRSLACSGDKPLGARRARTLYDIDEERFWNLLVNLLTQP